MAQPSNPAPVSGPGALSRRTDGGPAQKLRELPNAQYGEAQTFRELQQGAALAQSNPVSSSPTTGSMAGGGTPSIIPLNAPTTRPDEPVTAGSAFGPGPGPEALGPQVPQASVQLASAREQIAALAAQNPNNTALTYLAAKVGQGRL